MHYEAFCTGWKVITLCLFYGQEARIVAVVLRELFREKLNSFFLQSIQPEIGKVVQNSQVSLK